MREYELVYVIQPDAAPEREAQIHSRIDEVLEGSGSIRLFRDDWGKRKLAYEIKKFQKGHYIQVNFLSEGACVPEIERRLRLDVDVLRFLTILADEKVKDIEARVEEARVLQEDQERRRLEREQLEAEKAARLAAEAAARAEAEAAARAEAEAAARAETEAESSDGPAEGAAASEPESAEPAQDGAGPQEGSVAESVTAAAAPAASASEGTAPAGAEPQEAPGDSTRAEG